MFDPVTPVEVGAALGWLAIVAAGGFLVSWLSTDIGGLRRTPYIGVLAGVTAVITGGYLMWSDAAGAFWTNAWGWGVLGAIATGGFLAAQISRVVPTISHRGRPSAGTGLWEGLVYGVTEGLLLSVLPALVIWQWWTTQGRADGWGGLIGGLLALAASGLVIIVHHLGYRSYRNRKLIQPLVGCLVLSLGFLLTGSPITAMGGHVLLHLAMLRRGMEMPPERRPLDRTTGEIPSSVMT
jgi:hypothetical protein